ncbi:MAG: TiaS agmantine-binding domain-containing protein [Candidatus Kariarchaeaceae archaeon]|jgi:tRNA(Ile2)-agmatinylcytidine synthase
MDLWIGVDGTDSSSGGCTTWTMSRLLDDLYAADPGVVFHGYPRLVRLNPNVPYRTRGNAALAVHISTSLQIEEVGQLIQTRMTHDQSLYEPDELKTAACVVSTTQPPEELYWQALVRLLTPEEVLTMHTPEFYWPQDSQSLVGALAAIAAPSDDITFELLAYRREDEPREIDDIRVKQATESYLTTFSNWDDLRDRELVAPSGPDPVIVGIRGHEPGELENFLHDLGLDLESWTVFVSNQATGDYSKRGRITSRPHEVFSGLITLVEEPVEFEGGHLRAEGRHGGNIYRLLWFEPTKTLRDGARSLRAGDTIQLTAACGQDSTLNVEYMMIVDCPPHKVVTKPLCSCGNRMSSAGSFKGYKCKNCGNTSFEHDVTLHPREIYVGQQIYPNLGSQRHLLRPRSRRHITVQYYPRDLRLDEIRGR